MPTTTHYTRVYITIHGGAGLPSSELYDGTGSVLTPLSYFPAPNGICIKPVGHGVAPPVTPKGTVLRPQ